MWKYRIIKTIHLPQLHAFLACTETSCPINLWRCGSWPVKGKFSPRCECSDFATYYDFVEVCTKIRHVVWRSRYICNIWPLLFLDAFAKLRKVAVSFVMSLGLYVRMKHLGSHWIDIREILYFSIFFKTVDKIRVSLKSDKNTGTFYEYQCTFMTISRSFLLKMRNVLDVVEENTHI